MKENTCCFIGHRTIKETEELKSKLCEITKKLIVEKKVDTFLFGSKSQFNDLCYQVVTEIKEKHPHIKKVYVRTEYSYINNDYKQYLLKNYEDTYYPKNIINSGKSVYVKRNFEMINNSRFCIVYFNEQSSSTTRKSGTKIALDYAIKQGKQIKI